MGGGVEGGGVGSMAIERKREAARKRYVSVFEGGEGCDERESERRVAREREREKEREGKGGCVVMCCGCVQKDVGERERGENEGRRVSKGIWGTDIFSL